MYMHGLGARPIRQLIEQGKVPGRLDGDKVILGHLEPEHYDRLFSMQRPVIDLAHPDWVALKLPPELDPCTPAHDGVSR